MFVSSTQHHHLHCWTYQENLSFKTCVNCCILFCLDSHLTCAYNLFLFCLKNIFCMSELLWPFLFWTIIWSLLLRIHMTVPLFTHSWMLSNVGTRLLLSFYHGVKRKVVSTVCTSMLFLSISKTLACFRLQYAAETILNVNMLIVCCRRF